MAVEASTSAESKKTAGKCNITHRFDGPASPKNFTFPRFLAAPRVSSTSEPWPVAFVSSKRVWCGVKSDRSVDRCADTKRDCWLCGGSCHEQQPSFNPRFTTLAATKEGSSA